MARISGVELQDGWKLDYALTKIKGIGWSLSKKILDELDIDNKKEISKLTTEEIKKINSKVTEYPIEGDLTRDVRSNISRLKRTGTYRGQRHQRNLPVRGQRTKTNSRTKRGKRKTVGAFKKEALTKMQKQKGKKEEDKEK